MSDGVTTQAPPFGPPRGPAVEVARPLAAREGAILAFGLAAVPLLDRDPQFSAGFGALSLGDVVGGAIAFYFLAAVFLHGRMPRILGWWMLIGVLLVLMFFLDFLKYKTAPLLSLKEPLALIKIIVYVFSIVCLARDPKVFMKFMKFIVYIAVFNAFVVILSGFHIADVDLFVPFEGAERERSLVGRTIMEYELPFRRSSGLFRGYAYLGVFTTVAMAIVLYFRDHFKLPLVLFLILFAAVVVGQSRATWLAIALLLFCFGFHWVARKRRLAWVVFPIAVITVVAALPLIYELTTFVYDVLVAMRGKTVERRLNTFSLALQMAGGADFTGAGFRAWESTKDVHVLHNMYLVVLLGGGMLALLLLLVMIAIPLLTEIFSRRRFVAFSVSIWLPAVFVVNFSSGLSYYSFWCAIGIQLGLCVLPAAAPVQEPGFRLSGQKQ